MSTTTGMVPRTITDLKNAEPCGMAQYVDHLGVSSSWTAFTNVFLSLGSHCCQERIGGPTSPEETSDGESSRRIQKERPPAMTYSP